MNDHDAIAALVSDLHWQIDQLGPRGIKDKAGNPYNPSYYKRGLRNAIDRGDLAVADYVRRYLYKAASDGYRKLEDANSLDLACEALVADESKPYAQLFTETDRAAASRRLARAHRRDREAKGGDVGADRRATLRAARRPCATPRAGGRDDETRGRESPSTQRSFATLRMSAAMNRLERAYEAIGSIAQAKKTSSTPSTWT